MVVDTIFFKATDGVALNGIIYKSKKESKKILISVHGMSTNCLKKRDETIAKMINKNGIDLFAFNNRGHDIVNNIQKQGMEKMEFAGTAYEEISECYEDILGAVDFALNHDYEDIYLMGHSLGSTKVVYFYNRIIQENKEISKKIKAIILLSLVDIPFAVKAYLNSKYPSLVTYAKNMKKDGMEKILMPEESFIYPISVKNFLRYTLHSVDIDFAKFSDPSYDFKELNNIAVPLFMRWGNVRELIIQKAEDLCIFLKEKINNPSLDINYIDGANHSYTGKEEVLSEEISYFLSKVNDQ